MIIIWKNIITFLLIISILVFPFIHITDMLQTDIFLDSFENPDQYICLQSKGMTFASKIEKDELLIIQKSSHPDFLIKENDNILYFNEDGLIGITKISEIERIGSRYIYYKEIDLNRENKPIFEEQIIGRVLKIIDNHIINSITIKIWEISISSLNIGALIAGD